MLNTTRYYVGDASDLEGLSFEEMTTQTYYTYEGAVGAFEDMLDEVYGTVSICGVDYDAGRAFAEIDPIAFRVAASDSITEIDTDDFESEEDDEEYVSVCPACGEFIDYCQGHGEIGDPHGARVLEAHDDGIHDGCHTAAVYNGQCD